MYSLPYKPTEQELAKFIEIDFPNLIADKLSIDTSKYVIKGSVGQGRWTDTPWIGIFDKNITNTAQKGFYIVYLFRKDMQGVYLSLNQGTKYIKEKYKGQKPKDKMRKISSNIRRNLTYDISEFPLDRIDLLTSTDNGTHYMATHICGKYYPAFNIPSGNELAYDLQKMITVYSQLKKMLIGKTVEEMLDFYLQQEDIEDLQYQNDVLLATAAITPRRPQVVPQQNLSSKRRIWKRSASVAKEALQKINYLCEVDYKHLTFKSGVTGENFVEAHHLIPIRLQNHFSWSLDVPGNIVSLCPNCHREIHHATKKEKKKLIKTLYEKRRDDLYDYDILVPLYDIYKFYGC